MTPRPATRRERQTLSPSSPGETAFTEAFDPQALGLLIAGVFARFARDEHERLASVTAVRRSSRAFP
jgi:hypothetical protein